MRVRWLAVLSCLVGVFALGLAACGGDDDDPGGSSSSSGGISGDSLTIYSSLPLQGASKGQTDAVVDGEKLALEEGGKVGKYTVKYVSLDDSTAQNPGTGMRRQTAQNARKAVQDESTVVYIGEFNSGGAKISIPILNQAGIPQVSPANTYVGLTTDEPGSEPGEPDKYYPAQKRTYLRIVPARHDPGRGPGHDHEGGRLQEGRHRQRQGDLRRGPGAERRDRREGRRASRSGTTASTRTRRTTARCASKIKGPTASSFAA